MQTSVTKNAALCNLLLVLSNPSSAKALLNMLRFVHRLFSGLEALKLNFPELWDPQALSLGFRVSGFGRFCCKGVWFQYFVERLLSGGVGGG